MPKLNLPSPSGAFTVEESADYLRVSRATVFRLLQTRKIPRVRIGGRTVIRKTDLDSFLERSLERA